MSLAAGRVSSGRNGAVIRKCLIGGITKKDIFRLQISVDQSEIV